MPLQAFYAHIIHRRGLRTEIFSSRPSSSRRHQNRTVFPVVADCTLQDTASFARVHCQPDNEGMHVPRTQKRISRIFNFKDAGNRMMSVACEVMRGWHFLFFSKRV